MRLVSNSIWIVSIMVAGVMALSARANAEIIQFPEEQLAKESVTPVFDQPEAVKKRYVPFIERFELGAYTGATLSDPFFNSYPLGVSLGYHFTDVHSFNVSAAYFISGQTSYVSQIQQSSGSGASIPFGQAPYPHYMAQAQYEFTPYYGKISLTKQAVMNLTISATLGLGTMNTNTDSGFLASAGLNQRFFFNRNLGLKVDLQALFYQETDVVLRDVLFNPSKTNVTNVLLTFGMVYMLPSL